MCQVIGQCQSKAISVTSGEPSLQHKRSDFLPSLRSRTVLVVIDHPKSSFLNFRRSKQHHLRRRRESSSEQIRHNTGMRRAARDAEPVVRLKVCGSPDCHAVFTICISCDRGQRYCSAACRDTVRRQRRREADGRYQRSDRGREAHRCRQRRYRQRHTARVTDQGCQTITLPPPTAQSPIGHCRICGQFSRWTAPFPPIPRRWWTRRSRRPSG